MSLQVLGKLYAVLSDKEQKAIYDEQGVVDEESDVLKQDRCWEDYWRLLFPKVPEHRVIFVFSLTWLTNESQWMLFVCLCPGMMWHLSLRGGGYSKYMVRLHLCIIVNWCKHNIFQFVCFIINSLMFILVFTTCCLSTHLIDHSPGHTWVWEDVQGLWRGATGCDQALLTARGRYGRHHRLSSVLLPRRWAQAVQHDPRCHR